VPPGFGPSREDAGRVFLGRRAPHEICLRAAGGVSKWTPAEWLEDTEAKDLAYQHTGIRLLDSGAGLGSFSGLRLFDFNMYPLSAALPPMSRLSFVSVNPDFPSTLPLNHHVINHHFRATTPYFQISNPTVIIRSLAR